MSRDVARLAVLCGAGLTVGTAQAIVVPYVALYLGSLGAGEMAIGSVVASGFLVPLFGAVATGKLVDRFGVRRVLTWGAVVLLASVAPLAWRANVATLAAFTIAAHVGHVATVIAAQQAVARTIASKEAAFGWFTTFVSGGQLAGPLVMGASVDAFGYGGGAWAFAAAALLACLVAATSWPVLPPLRGGGEARPASVRAALRGSPAALLAIAGSGVGLFVIGAHQAFYPVFLASASVGAFTIGVVLATRALASILVRPFLAWAVARTGSRAAVFAGALAACAAGIALPLAPAPVGLALLGSVLIGVGAGLAQPVSMVLVTEAVPSATRGAALGVRMAVNYAGLGSASFAVGVGVAALGFGPAFLLAGAAPAVVAGVVAWRRGDVDWVDAG